MTNDIATTSPAARNAIAMLRRFARPRAAAVERCDLCAAPLAEEHQHLIDPVTRQLECACDACAVLFTGMKAGKLKRVPRDIEHWTDFVISDEQWEALGVPIALAFFFFSTPRDHIVTMYPSPGGATEAMLPADVWQLLVNDNAPLGRLEPDVEALLVNRMRGAREYYRMPIDHCFRLVGLIRTTWRGLSGGPRMMEAVDGFFRDLNIRCGGTVDTVVRDA